MRAQAVGMLLSFIVLTLLVSRAYAVEYKLELPLGLEEEAAYIPEDNPLTPEKIALGKQLYWDKRWSRNGTVACVSCHDPKLAFSDGRKVARGIGGAQGTRSAPAIVNRGYSRWTLKQLKLSPKFFPKSLLRRIVMMPRGKFLPPRKISASF